MIARILSAGDIIEARCTKCKAVLNHRIVAMVGDKVVRVECNTCGGVHNYYPPAGDKKTPYSSGSPRSKTVSTGKTGTAALKDREEWESLIPAMSSARAVPYDINGCYSLNDVIEHPVFGLGVVRKVIKPNKMEVVFREGKKLLRCVM